MTPGDLAYGPMSDEQKMFVISELLRSLSEEFKNQLVVELAGGNVSGETQLQVSSNGEAVRMDFGRPLAWFALPREQALQLGILLMQHAGASLERVDHKPNA